MTKKTLDRESQEIEKLLTRAINTLGEDVVLDAFVRAVGPNATPIDPSSTFEPWLAPDIRLCTESSTLRVNLPAAMDALTSELLRLMTRH